MNMGIEIRSMVGKIGGLLYSLFGFLPVLYKIRDLLYSGWWCKKVKACDCEFAYPLNSFVGYKHFKISKHCKFGKYSVLSAWSSFNGEKFNPDIIIKDNCRFGDYLHLTCINKIIVGSNVLTGRWVTISDNSHGSNCKEETNIAPNERLLFSKGPVIIEDNVWIGDKVSILAGVKIGKGSIIGANSVVTKDIPPFCIAGGIPCKVIKYL